MTDKQIQQARKMRDEGSSYRAIGRALNLAGRTVAAWLDPAVKARQRETDALWRTAHREKERMRAAAYRFTHKDQVRAYQKAYRARHREEAKLRTSKWRAVHEDKYKAGYLAYASTHREEDRVNSKAWREKHPVMVNAQSAMKRAVLAGALVGITIEQKTEIKEIYRRAKEDPKVRCYLCGKLIPKGHRHVDHIIPLSKGGLHRPSNLAIACDSCNMEKHNKMPGKMGVLI